MKPQLQVGLITEGKSTRSALLQLPNLADQIGPIKSSVFRLARRVSNFLRAGYAVTAYEELQPTRLILIKVPDAAIPRIVEEICASELDFSSLAFALCETWLTTSVLQPLADRGSSVATLVRISGSRRNWFVVEGHSLAVKQARQFLALSDARAFEIRPDSKTLYFAASLLTTAIPLSIFVTAQQALRSAGVSGNPLHALLEELGEGMLRDFLHGARTTWGGPLTECSEEIAESYFSDLHARDPELAAFINHQLTLARKTITREKLI